MNSKPQYLDVVFNYRVFKMATVAIVINQILKYKNDPNIKDEKFKYIKQK